MFFICKATFLTTMFFLVILSKTEPCQFSYVALYDVIIAGARTQQLRAFVSSQRSAGVGVAHTSPTATRLSTTLSRQTVSRETL